MGALALITLTFDLHIKVKVKGQGHHWKFIFFISNAFWNIFKDNKYYLTPKWTSTSILTYLPPHCDVL